MSYTVDKLNGVRALLVAGLDRLVTDGWIQGDYRNASGYCAVGAIGCESNWNGAYSDAWNELHDVVNPSPTMQTWSVTQWNDAPERTFDEVKTAFEKAIANIDRKIAWVMALPAGHTAIGAGRRPFRWSEITP